MNAVRKYALLLLILALAGSAFWLIAARSADDGVSSPPAAGPAPARQPAADIAGGTADVTGDARYYFDVAGHTPGEIAQLLRRAEELYESASGDQHTVSLAFVLHGPDVDLFARENYPRYRDVVDLAARLDALGVLDFKACATTARRRGLDNGAFPDFIELVPYAPDYIEELEADGYVSF